MDINQNLGNLMKEAQKMQQRMQEAQQKLADLRVTGESGGGMVIVEMNGRHEILSVKLKQAVLEEDVEFAGDLFAAAANAATRKVEEKSKEEIARLTQGLNIPKDLLEGEGGAGGKGQ